MDREQQKFKELLMLTKLGYFMAPYVFFHEPSGHLPPIYTHIAGMDEMDEKDVDIEQYKAKDLYLFLVRCVYLTNTQNMKLETGGNWTDYPNLNMDNNDFFNEELKIIIKNIRETKFDEDTENGNVFPRRLRENLATKLENILKSGADVLIKCISELKLAIFNFYREDEDDILLTEIVDDVRSRGMKALQEIKKNLGLFDGIQILEEEFGTNMNMEVCKIDGIYPPGMSPPSEKAGGRKRYRSKKMRKHNYRRSK
jgi:hypothetical protein